MLGCGRAAEKSGPLVLIPNGSGQSRGRGGKKSPPARVTLF